MPLDTAQNWFLLRGLVRESADWADFPQRLGRAIPGARVHCLDLPGNGRHYQMPAPPHVSQMVDFTRREFHEIREKHLRQDGRAVPNYVLAISLGAMATINWLQRYPKEIDSAILINTSLRGVSPFYRRISPRAYPTILKLFMVRDTRKREELILKLTSSRPELPPEVLEKRTAARVQHPISRNNAIRQILAGLSSAPAPTPPTTPLLLLNSLGDRLVDPECSLKLKDRWGVPLKTHPWANHDLPLDDPQWTLDAICEWVKALPVTRGA